MPVRIGFKLGDGALLTALTLLVGCGESTAPPGTPPRSNSGPSGIPVRGNSDDARLNPLDYEAAKQALGLWKPAKLGESYYVCQIEPPPAPQLGPKRTVFELRKIDVRVSGAVSEADKLNGIEWQGQVMLYATAGRSYCNFDTFGQPANIWSPWSRGETLASSQAVNCEKRSGKWTIVISKIGNQLSTGGVDVAAVSFKQVEQSDIPK